MMVDRHKRDRLADAIHRYLTEQTTAFEFDDEIQDIRGERDDPTIEHVANSLWFHYDDCNDHTVVLSKEAWDYFFRLILVLKSNAHIEVESRQRWHSAQAGAAITLTLFGLCIVWLGIGLHLLAVSVPFGVVSILLSDWRRRSIPQLSPAELALIPFSTFSEILTVRRSVGGFTKLRYPHHLRTKRIRTPLMGVAAALQSYGAWLLFSPFVLLCQLFPKTETHTHVRISP